MDKFFDGRKITKHFFDLFFWNHATALCGFEIRKLGLLNYYQAGIPEEITCKKCKKTWADLQELKHAKQII